MRVLGSVGLNGPSRTAAAQSLSARA